MTYKKAVGLQQISRIRHKSGVEIHVRFVLRFYWANKSQRVLVKPVILKVLQVLLWKVTIKKFL